MLDLDRFVSFLILYTVGRTPWTVISTSQGHYLHTKQTQNKRNQTSMSSVGFEPTIPAFERQKRVHVLRLRGHCDRIEMLVLYIFYLYISQLISIKLGARVFTLTIVRVIHFSSYQANVTYILRVYEEQFSI
jgi:hypothetical protein